MALRSKQLAAFPYGDFDKYKDLGSDHWFSLTKCLCENIEGPVVSPHGLVMPHLTEHGKWCGGCIAFAGHDPGRRTIDGKDYPSPVWTMTAIDPITVAEALACGACSDSGRIEEGRWVPA